MLPLKLPVFEDNTMGAWLSGFLTFGVYSLSKADEVR